MTMEQEVKRGPGRPKMEMKPMTQEITASTPQETSKVQPNLRVKGTEKFWHHQFKLENVNMKRNVSYKYNHVQLEELLHGHIYHSVDANGSVQEHCSPIGGHFHEVTWKVNENGDLVAKCGPPLRYVHKKFGSRQRRVIEKISWYDAENAQTVVDDHIHEVTYKWSEELDSKTVNDRQQAETKRAEIEVKQKRQVREMGGEAGFE